MHIKTSNYSSPGLTYAVRRQRSGTGVINKHCTQHVINKSLCKIYVRTRVDNLVAANLERPLN